MGSEILPEQRNHSYHIEVRVCTAFTNTGGDDGKRIIGITDAAMDQLLRYTWPDVQGRALASGIYLIRLEAGTQVITRKLMLLK